MHPTPGTTLLCPRQWRHRPFHSIPHAPPPPPRKGAAPRQRQASSSRVSGRTPGRSTALVLRRPYCNLAIWQGPRPADGALVGNPLAAASLGPAGCASMAIPFISPLKWQVARRRSPPCPCARRRQVAGVPRRVRRHDSDLRGPVSVPVVAVAMVVVVLSSTRTCASRGGSMGPSTSGDAPERKDAQARLARAPPLPPQPPAAGSTNETRRPPAMYKEAPAPCLRQVRPSADRLARRRLAPCCACRHSLQRAACRSFYIVRDSRYTHTYTQSP